jgi:predicted Fe-Mo cluster-binding NifX family protein
MRIAIPTSNDRLDMHFGRCSKFTILDVSSAEIQRKTCLYAPPHEPGSIPNWLADKNVTDIIAGGIGRKAIHILNQRGINVHQGAPPEQPEALVESFLDGSIGFAPNSCQGGHQTCH